jgi:hypothetical protein
MAIQDIVVMLFGVKPEILHQKQGYQAPEILPMCDYYRNSQNPVLVRLSVIPWS